MPSKFIASLAAVLAGYLCTWFVLGGPGEPAAAGWAFAMSVFVAPLLLLYPQVLTFRSNALVWGLAGVVVVLGAPWLLRGEDSPGNALTELWLVLVFAVAWLTGVLVYRALTAGERAPAKPEPMFNLPPIKIYGFGRFLVRPDLSIGAEDYRSAGMLLAQAVTVVWIIGGFVLRSVGVERTASIAVAVAVMVYMAICLIAARLRDLQYSGALALAPLGLAVGFRLLTGAVDNDLDPAAVIGFLSAAVPFLYLVVTLALLAFPQSTRSAQR